jgi:hypothetical protein
MRLQGWGTGDFGLETGIKKQMQRQRQLNQSLRLRLRSTGLTPRVRRRAEARLYLEATAKTTWLRDGSHPTYRKCAMDGALGSCFYGSLRNCHGTACVYHPSGGNPMTRFALFTVALFAIVTIGAQSQSRHGGNSLKSMCVCVPARAKLMLKSAIVNTQARSAQLFTAAQ